MVCRLGGGLWLAGSDSNVFYRCQRFSKASWVVAEDERARCEGGGVIDGL